MSRLRSIGERSYLGWGLVNLASYLIARDSIADARETAREGLSIVRGEGGFIVRVCLQQWALFTALAGRQVEAARLLGFVDNGYSAAGEERQPTELKIHSRLMKHLAAVLTDVDIARYALEGTCWSENEAVRFVQSEIQQQTAER
ncbi:MAG: hypothetical protein WDN69_34670 [Aliidongia sp.]